ncbi:hypothetical protein F5Y11DRAFT_348961 [Daldinia sp. FL1419]|nr:hypothetical protein F5Y11DRAFT_348961 [Daldinia sp. FL1419]
MLLKAQTFPLGIDRLAIGDRNETWKSDEARPFSLLDQKRVCYPNLEPWMPQDGQRRLSPELEGVIKGLREKDDFLGTQESLREKWSIKFEAANRRTDGAHATIVPTIMIVAWDENDRGYNTDDEQLWTEACKDIINFLRENGAAYFGVEIIHWDRLDYQVVT